MRGGARPKPDASIERDGPRAWPDALVAGVDEVGRGPLAGPVTAAAVVLDPVDVPGGLDDSKRLSAPQRTRLAEEIAARALAFAIVSIPAPAIDRTNIRLCALEAMRRAVQGLAVAPERVLVDGRDGLKGLDAPCEAIVGGDGRSVSIAAASILAKVARDRMMARAAERWPLHGFERHCGYGTKAHRDALAAKGPCALHRRSFGSLRADRQR